MQQQVKMSGFTSALRGAALQQQRPGSRRAPAAAGRQAVQAATPVATRKLKASEAKPAAPLPPRRTPPYTGSKVGTLKIGPKKAAGSAPPKQSLVGTILFGGTRPVGGGGAGTRPAVGTRKVTSIEVDSKEKLFRQKRQGISKPTPKILARIQQLKLLSKLEQSGLLSALEKNGVTLSKLEQSGALSTAEKLGAVSLLADRNAPGALYTLAIGLLAAGPTAVYFLPDGSGALVALQVAVAAACVAGGAAAWGGASLLSSLQK